VRNPNNITDAERTATEEEVVDAVKAALLISGAGKQRYGRLKEQLANNYLLGTDQYPDTLEKASRILENYQVGKGPLLEIVGTQTKGGGWHSCSEEPIWDEATEDAGLRPWEEEEETPPRAEEMQQAWVLLR
jgi:hypothetical protein